MYKYIYFRVLIEEKLTTGESLIQLYYIQLVMMQLFKIIRAAHSTENALLK